MRFLRIHVHRIVNKSFVSMVNIIIERERMHVAWYLQSVLKTALKFNPIVLARIDN